MIDTGPGIPGGYTDRGTPDTDTDTDFCIRCHTCTPTRHTHTHNGGYVSWKSGVFCIFILNSFYLFICSLLVVTTTWTTWTYLSNTTNTATTTATATTVLPTPSPAWGRMSQEWVDGWNEVKRTNGPKWHLVGRFFFLFIRVFLITTNFFIV